MSFAVETLTVSPFMARCTAEIQRPEAAARAFRPARFSCIRVFRPGIVVIGTVAIKPPFNQDAGHRPPKHPADGSAPRPLYVLHAIIIDLFISWGCCP